MKLLLIIFASVLSLLPACVQAQYTIDRQPFSGANHPMLRSPGDGLPNDDTGGGSFVGGDNGNGGGGSPWDDLPNGNEGEGGWVGQEVPVKDTCWFSLVLAIGYGVYRSRKRRVSQF